MMNAEPGMKTETKKYEGGGSFLTHNATADEIFTREDLSPAQVMFGQIAEDFMNAEVVPNDERIHAKDWKLTRELLLKAGELDLLRVDIPEAFDGLGLDKVSSAYVGEKIGIMPSFAGSLGAHTTIGTLPIVYFGSDAQKAKYLPKLASGEWIAAFCLTEPESGSDALAARTKAVLSEDGKFYVLNGQKMWITNGGFADVFAIFAKVDGDKFTAFIVEREMGVVSGREEPKLGLDGSSTTALILENVRVPVENVLGKIGEGHKVAFNILNIGRVKLGTRNIGSAKQSLNRAMQYAVERQQFGKSISEFGMIKQKIGEMAIRCFVGDAMVFRTLGDVDNALEAVDKSDAAQTLRTIENFAVECSINKVWSSETLAFVVDEALQIYGGYGYSKEYPAERAYRDARITRLYEGTNEINRLIIPTRLLKNQVTAHLFAGENAQNLLENNRTVSHNQTFSAERDLLSRAKKLLVFLLNRAKSTYADKLSNEQEILGHIADMTIEIYAVESAVLRAEKLSNKNNEAKNAIAADMTRSYASDAADRIEHSAKQVAAALSESEDVFERVQKLTGFKTYNTVAARRRIADSVIEAGRYYF